MKSKNPIVLKSVNPKDKLEEVASSHSFIKEIVKPNLLVCCLCGKEFKGFGNNAQPLADGLCCDACNCGKVIPARVYGLTSKQRKDLKGGKKNDGRNN